MELYSCCVEEEFSVGFSSRRLSRLGSASSKKFMASLETAASCSSHGSGTGSGDGGVSPVLLPALSVRWGSSIYVITYINKLYTTKIHDTGKTLNVERVSHMGCICWNQYTNINRSIRSDCQNRHTHLDFLFSQHLVCLRWEPKNQNRETKDMDGDRCWNQLNIFRVDLMKPVLSESFFKTSFIFQFFYFLHYFLSLKIIYYDAIFTRLKHHLK